MEDEGDTTAEYYLGTIDEVSFGSYRIRRLIAPGGIIRCYEAIDVRFGDVVALQTQLTPTLHVPNDSRKRGPIYNEAATLRHLDHPGIVRILDYRDEHEQGPFLVTEFIPWRTLDDLLADIPTDSRLKLLPVIRDIADALSYCHSLGIIHRDIKPTNIFAEEVGGQFRTKLAGFYLALRLADQVDPDGMIAGTPAYMSPEQFKGEALTAKSDVYSLGVVLFEVLAGVSLFQLHGGRDGFDTWRSFEDVPDLALAKVPFYGRHLVARMLSLDPRARPDMRDVHAELKSLAIASNDSQTGLLRDRRRRTVANHEQGRGPGVIIAVVLGVLAMAVTDAITGGRSGGIGFLVGAFIGLILTAAMGLLDAGGADEAP